MAIELSTAGVTLSYGVAVARPTASANYTLISGIKSIPDFNPEPSSLETTDLSQTEWKTYIPGLKDIGGSLAFGANNTEDFQEDWATLVSAYETGAALATPQYTWFCVKVPGLTKSFYFKGEPSSLGLSAIEVDGVLEIDAYVTPTGITGWATAPTS